VKRTLQNAYINLKAAAVWSLLSIVHGIWPAAPLAMAETDTESESQQPTNRASTD